MIAKTLSELTSNEFLLSLGVLTSPRSAYRCLKRSESVRNVRDAITHGHVSESAIRDFVQKLSSQFETGVQFFHEPALAALAIAMESRSTKFADDLLLDIARLKSRAEFSLAPQVAGICLMNRYARPKTKVTNTSKSRCFSRTTENWIDRSYSRGGIARNRASGTIVIVEELSKDAQS